MRVFLIVLAVINTLLYVFAAFCFWDWFWFERLADMRPVDRFQIATMWAMVCSLSLVAI